MKKLRFKNRNGILYFGFSGQFKSSKMKFNKINKNILIGRFQRGELSVDLTFEERKSPSLKNLLEDVMNDKKKHLKFKSIQAYSTAKNNHIIPYFRDKLITELKPIDIKKYQDHLVDKGLKKDSIQLSRILLKEVFNLAILSEVVSVNLIKLVDPPKLNHKKPKQKPFTLDEIDLILSTAKGEIRNFLGISLFTGMRSGELLALKWEDVDFNSETITIDKTIAAGHINSAKTKSSERDIEMLEKVKEFLKLQRLETGLKNSYVFLNQSGSHYNTNDGIYKKYQSVLKEANLEKRPLHNTRHTFASIMLNNGIEALWVSNTLGHSDLQTTLKIYTHYMPRKEKMVIPFLEKRYKNGTN